MTAPQREKKIIGRAEIISFPEIKMEAVHARIDTGAKTSAVWASHIEVRDGALHVVFFGEGHEGYTGETVIFDDFGQAVVASSTGETQVRYKVRQLVRIKGRKVRAWFTLADRSTQVYPVLIGRNVLMGKFIVDVNRGQVLRDEEESRTTELRSKLEHDNPEEGTL